MRHDRLEPRPIALTLNERVFTFCRLKDRDGRAVHAKHHIDLSKREGAPHEHQRSCTVRNRRHPPTPRPQGPSRTSVRARRSLLGGAHADDEIVVAVTLSKPA